MGKQRKWISWLLMVVMLAGMMPWSLAELEEEEDAPVGWHDAPFLMLYSAGRRLLTGTENFTAMGTADFYLDGTFFKHADGLYAQDGENSYQSISLRTPRPDGTERENGYAVVDYEGTGYSIERYLGETHVSAISNEPKSETLRDSVQTTMLLNLGEQMAAYLDTTIRDQMTVASDAEDMTHKLRWDADYFPEMLQSGLNLFWQAAIQRYFLFSYEDVPVYAEAPIEDYLTVTQGMIFSTQKLELQDLHLAAEFNENDDLVLLEGRVQLEVLCRNEARRELQITFTLECLDYGTTSIQNVIPSEDQNASFLTEGPSALEIPQYFQTASARGFSWTEKGLPDVVFPADRLNHRAIASLEAAEEYAVEIASMDALGCESAWLMEWTIDLDEENGRYEARGIYPDDPVMPEPALTLIFDRTGFVWSIRNGGSGFADAEEIYSEAFDSDTYTDWRSEISLALWAFQENLNPGSTRLFAETLRVQRASGVNYASYHETLALEDGRQFVVMYGMLHQNLEEKVKYVMQTAPIFRVVQMDATIDPDEGGNG